MGIGTERSDGSSKDSARARGVRFTVGFLAVSHAIGAPLTAILVRSLTPWAAAGLTLITLGAVVSHLRIASPSTALPAVAYTALQVWVGLERRGGAGRPGAMPPVIQGAPTGPCGRGGRGRGRT